MEALELVLFLLAAIVASGVVGRFLPALSLPLVQIALGALIGACVVTPVEADLDAELLLILFIAPLHFNESRHADSGALWNSRRGIASLAVGLVVATTVTVGFSLYALLPAIPLAAAIALGAAMGSTDAVAVTELSKDFRFGKRHETLLAGEAFFNDVTGTVVFRTAIAFAATGALSLTHAGEEFALDLFGGLLGGAVFGFLAWGLLELIRRRGIDSPNLHVTLELLLPFVIYLACKQLHIGAVIAVVVAGMVMSLLPHRYTLQTARQRMQSKGVWDTLGFILNGIIFLLLGMQLPRILQPAADGGLGDPLQLLGIILVLTVVLEAVRFVWIAGMDVVHCLRCGDSLRSLLDGAHIRSALAMAFAGPKGGITLSLMLTVPSTLPGAGALPVHDMLASIASGVILCTLLLANFAVPALVPHKAASRRTKKQVDAEARIVMRVIESIKEDAHLTGSVTGADAQRIAAGTDAVDEPATAIVMKRYADQLGDLVPLASKDVAEQGRAVVAQVDELYDRIEDIDAELREAGLYASETDGSDATDANVLEAHLRSLRETYTAVEDIQAQALVRELECVRRMAEDGDIDAKHAKELRNDVYIQQLAL